MRIYKYTQVKDFQVPYWNADKRDYDIITLTGYEVDSIIGNVDETDKLIFERLQAENIRLVAHRCTQTIRMGIRKHWNISEFATGLMITSSKQKRINFRESTTRDMGMHALMELIQLNSIDKVIKTIRRKQEIRILNE